MNVDTSFVSPPVGASPSSINRSHDVNKIAIKAFDQISVSSVLVTLLVSLILYDQGQLEMRLCSSRYKIRF